MTRMNTVLSLVENGNLDPSPKLTIDLNLSVRQTALLEHIITSFKDDCSVAYKLDLKVLEAQLVCAIFRNAVHQANLLTPDELDSL